jgi:hypothetical protein
MMAMLSLLINQEAKMAIDLTSITASVATQTTVDASIVQLCDNITAALAAIPPSTDPVTQAAIVALQATIDTNNAAIAADVVKNTPAAPTS